MRKRLRGPDEVPAQHAPPNPDRLLVAARVWGEGRPYVQGATFPPGADHQAREDIRAQLTEQLEARLAAHVMSLDRRKVEYLCVPDDVANRERMRRFMQGGKVARTRAMKTHKLLVF